MMPSCVPATPMETSGAKILDNDINDYVHRYSDRIIGLGEMMNYGGVLSDDEEVLSKLLVVGYRPKDGHAPLLSAKSLNAYIVAGLGSDHECSKLDEALEKLRKGMTQEKNLQALVPLINEFNSFKMSLVSDDRDPIDLKENGHLDYLVRRAISYGVTPIRAIQMASINTARYFRIKDQGAIAPEFRADFMLLDDLNSFKISSVFIDGMEVGKNNSSGVILEDYDYRSSTSDLLENTMRVKSLDNDYIFRIPGRGSWVQVIGVTPGQIITEKRILQAKLDDGFAVADPRRDIAKLVVIERHHKTGNVGLGFVQGLGIEKRAIVSSVAHDSHNLVVAGMSDSDMMVAARHICSIGGGLSVAYNGQIIANLPLLIAGLMSDKPIELVIANVKTVNEACKILGNNVIRDPFMLLSFLSLTVIPSLKLTDKGLFDVDKFRLTNL
jgi:adenine deaminase